MKNVLVLHGTNADHTQNWFPWLERELQNLGCEVWVPDLPQADHPDIRRYNEFLLDRSANWKFDKSSVIIGHSSGAVEILGLLNDPSFPDVTVGACFLVGAFKGDLGWESLGGMVENFDFDRIKQRSSKFVFIHSDDDPYCPIDDARDLCRQLDGEFIELAGQGHFTASLNPRYTAFPELIEAVASET